MLRFFFLLLVLLLAAPSAPLAQSTTPTPTPVPAEDCENCLDDDGDGAVDRADTQCAPPIDGNATGFGDAAGRALDKCGKTLQRAGAKLAWARLTAVASCLKAAAICIQTRPADSACRLLATDACTRSLAKLVPATTALAPALARSCGTPAVTSTQLLAAFGVGFGGETEPCARRDAAPLAGVDDVATCVERQHACAVDRALGAAVPRAAELLAFAGRNVASEFPCLGSGADGGNAGVAPSDRKALRRCDDAIQRATQRLMRARQKKLQSCAAPVFTCVQTKPNDGGCLARARSKCAAAFGDLPGFDAALASSIARACGAVDAADLTSASGLGFGSRAGRCAALGSGGAGSADAIAACLVRELRCRTHQLAENETPRLRELIGTGGQSLAPTVTPTPTPPPDPTPTSTAPPGFWDASGIPAAQNVMMFKFLNRTNGQYDDAHVFWSVDIDGAKETHSIAEQPFFDMPAHSAGRIYVYLGSVGTTPTHYYDFLEYTIGANRFNGNTTRVDAFGIKLALRLHCAGGFEATVGESPAVFAESRAATFQRFLDAVPAQFDALAQLQAPYRILNPGWGGFSAGGAHQDYYADYIDEVWATNHLTIPKAGPNASGLGAHPNLSAAIYRHTAAPGTFAPDGKLLKTDMWDDPATFYLHDPADHYAKFWHDNAIDGKAYGFPYDDVGGYSTFIAHDDPEYVLVAIGW
jgi:hypothetical protein